MNRVLPLLLALLLIASHVAFFARDLGGGDIQHYDAYSTMNRSLGFLRTGEWTTIRDNGSPNFHKPPLQYILTAGLLSTGMDAELALRLWPFVFTAGAVALTALLAALIAPASGWWAAPAAAALLTGSAMVWTHARMGMLDGGQSFFLLLALGGALLAARDPRFWFAAALGVGLGFLQKSPIAGLVLAFVIWMQSRWDPDGPLAWRTLRRDPHFRRSAWMAALLCAAWPLLQVAQHGPEFLEEFFVDQMLDRYVANNPFDRSSDYANLRWLEWLSKDAPQIWWPCLLAVACVLLVPRFRANTTLRSLALFVAVCCAVLSQAGGNIYGRYMLVLMPLLAVIGACVLVDWLPRPWFAFLACTALLAWSLPDLATVPARVYARDRTAMIEVSERYRALARAGDSPVFVSPRDLHGFSPVAFRYYADVRPTLSHRNGGWKSFPKYAARRGLGPPYSGVAHVDHFAETQQHLGPLLKLVEVGPYVIWRQIEPTPYR